MGMAGTCKERIRSNRRYQAVVKEGPSNDGTHYSEEKTRLPVLLADKLDERVVDAPAVREEEAAPGRKLSRKEKPEEKSALNDISPTLKL